MFEILKNFTDTILIITGFIISYPKISMDQEQLIRQNNNLYLQFTVLNQINPKIREIIESGNEVIIYYLITTYQDNVIIFEKLETRKISYSNTNYLFNQNRIANFQELTNRVSHERLVVLTNIEFYKGLKLQTDMELLIACEKWPEIIEFWSEKPKFSYPFQWKGGK